MNIAVYCASADGSCEVYHDIAHQLGSWIGENGHTLVYGGGRAGLMGIVADATIAAGANVIGVLPDTARIQAKRHAGLTRYIETQTVSERKAKMIELADAFVALPGGPGTLDEIAEVISLAKIGILPKPCIVVNCNGFYDPLHSLYEEMFAAGFMTEEELSRISFVDDIKSCEAIIASQLVG